MLSDANIWSLDYIPGVHAATVSRYLFLTGISQPEGKWIMPETRFTSFPALSVGPRVEISRSASGIHD